MTSQTLHVFPETTITTGPAEGATTTDPMPRFEFRSEAPTPTSSPGSSFECRLDAADFLSCTSPHTAATGDGPHTFAVRAVDSDGDHDPSPATRSFTVDTTP